MPTDDRGFTADSLKERAWDLYVRSPFGPPSVTDKPPILDYSQKMATAASFVPTAFTYLDSLDVLKDKAPELYNRLKTITNSVGRAGDLQGIATDMVDVFRDSQMATMEGKFAEMSTYIFLDHFAHRSIAIADELIKKETGQEPFDNLFRNVASRSGMLTDTLVQARRRRSFLYIPEVKRRDALFPESPTFRAPSWEYHPLNTDIVRDAQRQLLDLEQRLTAQRQLAQQREVLSGRGFSEVGSDPVIP